MDLINATPMRAGYTLGLDPSGQERIVVVVKGTFEMPSEGGGAAIHSIQEPLVFADSFTGDPGQSAVVYESDFAPQKPFCDVLLLGSAYAPYGQPVDIVSVGLRVGLLRKQFEVVGKRYWAVPLAGSPTPSKPEPFVRQSISYDVAFGGGVTTVGTPEMVDRYAPNPVGVGYCKFRSEDVFGTWVPNTQEAGTPIRSPHETYRPMSFGPLGRNFEERLRYAGTYDENWLDQHFPFLPPDFRLQYYQAAPSDQQLAHLKGGECVELQNLTPLPLAPFKLPNISVPIEFSDVNAQHTMCLGCLDTVLLEPDEGRLQLTWRASLALKRNIQEISQVVIGRMPRGWYRARKLGKTYYPSIRHLPAANRGQ